MPDIEFGDLRQGRDGLRAGVIEAVPGMHFEAEALPQIAELNIGHFLIGESVFEGLPETIKLMRAAMDRGRKKAGA